MIRSLLWTRDGELRENPGSAALQQALSDPDALLWVDLSQESANASQRILQDRFDFHPLAVEDALEERHVPRVDDWGEYLYIVLHAVRFDADGDEPLAALELDVFIGPNYLVTHHLRPMPALARVWSRCLDKDCIGSLAAAADTPDDSQPPRGPGYLFHRIADEMVSDIVPVIEEIDDRIDAIEDEIFADPTRSTLHATFTLRRALLRLRRILGPQREVFRSLATAQYAAVPAGDRVFYRDIYDHLVRLYELSEGLRDLAGGALDTYLSVVNNRMNEVMKVLTVITTLFMPLSFLAGFFGMNFFQAAAPLDAWTSPTAFALMLATMVLSPLAMAIWLRRHGWM